ncbi:MAG: chemotaxis protein CheW, partial [Planctomycetia bacterium]
MTGVLADRVGPEEPPVPDCWRRIGTDGDRTCPELATFVHCRNCPVVAAAARRFFDRPPPAGYLESWHAVLEHDDRPPDVDARSVLVFRLGK